MNHPLMAWMVENVAMTLTIRVRGEDGLTAFHRLRGKAFSKRMVGLAELCLYKLPTKGPTHDEGGKLERRWKKCIFLEYNRMSNEYTVFDTEAGKVAKARSMMRKPMDEGWSHEEMSKVTMRPHDTHVAREPEVSFERKADEDKQAEEEQQRIVRRLYMRKADSDKHGYTEEN